METTTPTLDASRDAIYQEVSVARAAAYRARLAAAWGDAEVAGAGLAAQRWRALQATRVPFTAPGAPTP